jgi:hypothetical protein
MPVDDPLDSAIHKALKRDGLAEAERMTGCSYKKDEATMAVGLALHCDINESRRSLLSVAGDSYFGITPESFQRVLDRGGFATVLVEPFVGRNDVEEKLSVCYNEPDGLLLSWETYNGDCINGGKVYYNWLPNKEINRFQFTSSGSLEGDVWVGDHDVREGLLHNMDAMRRHGTFVAPWVKSPLVWFLTYMDHDSTRGIDGFRVYKTLYDAKTAERIAKLPPIVQERCRLKGGDA